MDFLQTTFLVLIALTGFYSRRPFLNFPMDDDFAIYTYRARFKGRGLQWQKDLQIIGIPMWRMLLKDKWYGHPDGGMQRIRHLQTFFHITASSVVFFAVLTFTANPWAALTAGLLHAFYGTSPDLTAGSYNHEQFYIPFILLGLLLLTSGPQQVFLAGLCFGLATIPKYTTGLYPAVLSLAVAWQYGLIALALFAGGTALPMIVSNLIDLKLGFWNELSRKQMQTRMATTLRLTRTKAMHFSIAVEIRDLILQTLPVWVAGVAGLMISFSGEQGIWTGCFTGVTLAMILFQRAFSRYHYLPLIVWLSLGSGWAVDFVLREGGTTATVVILSFLALTAWNIKNLLCFYLRPTDPATLAKLEKFDQYIYLPYLGKILKRLARMKGETEERIFVWGTFSQLYHLTGLPAADNYLHHSIGPWDTQALEGFFDGVIGGLIRHKPVYLIKTFPDLDMDLLERVTGIRYRRIKVVLARFALYRLEGFTAVCENPLALSWQEKMRIMEKLTAGAWHAPAIDRSDFQCGDTATALKECRKLIRINPHDTPGLAFLGELYAHRGQSINAIAAFEKALSLEPSRTHVRLMLARQKIHLGLIEEARWLIDEETRRFGTGDEVLFLNGLILQCQNDHHGAMEAFERFRAVHPQRHDCWQALVESLTILQDREQLVRLYAESENTEKESDRDWLKARAASAIARVDAPLRAESKTLDHYLNQDAENCLLQYARASALEKEGDIENAYRLFKTIACSTKSYPHIQAGAWFRRALLSRWERRKFYLKKCLQLNPEHLAARRLLTEIRSDTQAGETAIKDDDRKTGSL